MNPNYVPCRKCGKRPAVIRETLMCTRCSTISTIDALSRFNLRKAMRLD